MDPGTGGRWASVDTGGREHWEVEVEVETRRSGGLASEGHWVDDLHPQLVSVEKFMCLAAG